MVRPDVLMFDINFSELWSLRASEFTVWLDC